jgi:hypothetical protein
MPDTIRGMRLSVKDNRSMGGVGASIGIVGANLLIHGFTRQTAKLVLIIPVAFVLALVLDPIGRRFIERRGNRSG